VRSPADPPHSLVIPPGSSVMDIARAVHRLGLARHPEVFRLLVVEKRAAGRLRAGEYSLEGSMSLEQVVDKLVRGDVVRRAVTIPEGSDLEDMARLVAARGISAEEFLKAARDPALIRDLDPEARDLEGYLFPDTYDLTRRPDEAAWLVGRMVDRFREIIAPELPGLPARGLSLRELVTLASVVELETAQGAERPRIAAVFQNRLRRRMPLQTDPTVIYALRKAGSYDGNIRKEDLSMDSPYNTYRYPGLPPGPIGSPGRAALQAVMQPADVKDLYFVSRNDGTHVFSETLADHERAVTVYQRHRRGLPAPSPAPSGLPGGVPPTPLPPASPGAR
jgi:peptidoglycan lytic transglycosylase G